MKREKSIPPRDTRDTRKPFESFRYQFTLDWKETILEPLPDIAERRAQHCEGVAEMFAVEKKHVRARKARGAAAAWRGLRGMSKPEAADIEQEWVTDSKESIDGLLVRAEVSERAQTDLALLAIDILDGLRGIAAGGDKNAAAVLMGALGRATLDFELLARAKPEIFIEAARKRFTIPGSISQNTEKHADNAKFASLLEVGKEAMIQGTPKGGKTWKHDEKNSLAVDLVFYITGIRDLAPLRALERASGLREPEPEWLADALKLEPFGPDSWPAWEEIAWRILDKGKHPATAILAPHRKSNPSDSLQRADARKALKRALRMIATGG